LSKNLENRKKKNNNPKRDW